MIFKFIIIFCLINLILPLQGCAQNQTMEAVKKEYKSVGDISLNLHIFHANKIVNSRQPAMVFFHPGGWISGEPEFFYNQCHKYARHGFVTISVQYRLANYGGLTPINCVEDAKDALIWIFDNAEELNVDTSAVTLVGYSAGGHLALMTQLTDYGGKCTVKNIILYAAPTDLTEDRLTAQLIKSKEAIYKLSPINNLRPITSRIHVFHGKQDNIVDFGTIERFVGRAKDLGLKIALDAYDNVGHFILSEPTLNHELEQKVDQIIGLK
ncbi:MAG: alpha/beta hydrolase [Bacteroidota bacterium]